MHRTLIALSLALVSLAAPALARAVPARVQDEDPAMVLDAAAEAIANAPGLVARLTLGGEGSDMIKNAMPTITGRFSMGEHPDFGRAIHLIGQFIAKPGAAPETFDIVRASDRFIWADHEKSTLNIRPLSLSARQKPTVFNYLTMLPMLDSPPLATLTDDAESMELEAQELVGDTLCDVVSINYARGSGRAHNKERWFIAVDDRLPRRIEQVTDAGMIKAALVLELGGLEARELVAPDLEVFKPESYTVSDTVTKRPEPAQPSAGQTTTRRPEPQTPRAPVKPRAPSYEFTTADSTTINNASQSGRTTVIAFGGSWCIPCKDLLPELATITESNAAQPVDVVYAAIRESDPQAAIDAHTDAGQPFHLEARTKPELVRAFKVRIYPTVVVIDPEGIIVYEGHITRDKDAAALASEVASAIDSTLTEDTDAP